MSSAGLAQPGQSDAARVTNRGGGSPFVIVCDHASNFIPRPLGTLGLDPVQLDRHIAWDPGALAVAQGLAALLDAPLVQSCISRLVIDCNRPPDAPDLISQISETTEIPGNLDLDAAARTERIDLAYKPYHDLLEAVVMERLAAGHRVALVAVHSFTPVYKSVSRPWHIGVVHDDDACLAEPLVAALRRHEGIVVGVNEPYSPADRVYYTLERHARSRGLPCVMIEIRNDEIADSEGQRLWASRLSSILAAMGVSGGARHQAAWQEQDHA